jgi:hypothetical protein
MLFQQAAPLTMSYPALSLDASEKVGVVFGAKINVPALPRRLLSHLCEGAPQWSARDLDQTLERPVQF